MARFLDLPADARAALRRVRPEFFTGGRAIAFLFAEIDEALAEYDNPVLMRAYRDRLRRFLDRHTLPYRLDLQPIRLTPLLHSEVDSLYRVLREKAGANAGLQEALTAFENAWERQSAGVDPDQREGGDPTASLLAENMLVAASNGNETEFTRALNRMRNGNRFPSNDFANIFDRAYTFANTYPNIRHPGNAAV